MRLKALAGWLHRRGLESMCRRIVERRDCGPVVSFTFDDFPRSAYTVGAHCLRSVGAVGTYYVAMGLMGTTSALGEYFCRDDLVSLRREGHELGVHTFSHISARSVELSTFLGDVKRGYDAIREGNSDMYCNFAYPYGAITMRAKIAVAKQMKSCRSTYGGLNGPRVDLNLLRANALYGTVSSVARVRELIRAAKERKDWLIFYTHDIRDNPSPYGCTPELFETTVAAVIDSGVRILPVDKAITEITSLPHS